MRRTCPATGCRPTCPTWRDGDAYVALAAASLSPLVPAAGVHLVGFSFGGAVAAGVARAWGARVVRLSLIGPGGFGRAEGRRLAIRSRADTDGSDAAHRDVIRHNLGATMFADPATADAAAIGQQLWNIAHTRLRQPQRQPSAPPARRPRARRVPGAGDLGRARRVRPPDAGAARGARACRAARRPHRLAWPTPAIGHSTNGRTRSSGCCSTFTRRRRRHRRTHELRNDRSRTGRRQPRRDVAAAGAPERREHGRDGRDHRGGGSRGRRSVRARDHPHRGHRVLSPPART